ncbi:MAG: hypothetical protein AAF290_06990 [Pseudomonadota bacterium]
MKRRKFIQSATSSAGLMLLDTALAQTACPPVLSDGAPARPCPAGDLEGDWAARTSGAGVVWFHDFRNDAEVDNFRWSSGLGNDPNDTRSPGRCIRNTSDGITGGGCLELIHPVGSGGAPGWWRPFGPMSGASNGRGENDPAAAGTMNLEAWDPSNRGVNEAYRRSYYAHPSYIGADGWDNDRFDGSEFYLQFRIKIDPNRFRAGTPSAGKQSFLATTQSTLNQEIVQQNERNRRALWYTNFGSSPDTGGSMGVDNGTKQPGSDYDRCTQGGPCWEYADAQWVTWLYHLVPGTDGDRNTLFEAFVARPGETSYETVFSQMNTINFSDTPRHPKGYNAFQPSNYMNGQATTVAWYQRYDQIIFSKQFIPCPQVG